MMILLTGGTGFIGSHTAVELIQANYDLVIVDNLSNSNIDVINKIQAIVKKNVTFIEGDIRDKNLISSTIKKYLITTVIHFAGLKSVNESTENPSLYYDNNVNGTQALLEAMEENNVRNLIFSSSATVYGSPIYLPIDENHPLKATNPYGQNKIDIENMLADKSKDGKWKVVSLRYFNPIGAHPSGLLGESSKETPNNLFPYIFKVIKKEIKELPVYGNDYKTRDGTCIRDYIDIIDLAKAHIKAIDFIKVTNGFHIFNIGTNKGLSVLEIIHLFETVLNIKLNYKFSKRRIGDVESCYANAKKANKIFKWIAETDIENSIINAYKFNLNNKF